MPVTIVSTNLMVRVQLVGNENEKVRKIWKVEPFSKFFDSFWPSQNVRQFLNYEGGRQLHAIAFSAHNNVGISFHPSPHKINEMKDHSQHLSG